MASVDGKHSRHAGTVTLKSDICDADERSLYRCALMGRAIISRLIHGIGGRRRSCKPACPRLIKKGLKEETSKMAADGGFSVEDVASRELPD